MNKESKELLIVFCLAIGFSLMMTTVNYFVHYKKSSIQKEHPIKYALVVSMTEWVECGVIDDDFDYTTHQVVDAFGQRGPIFKLNNTYRLSKDDGLASRRDQIKRCVELQQSQHQADYHSLFYYQPIQIIQIIPARRNHEQTIN